MFVHLYVRARVYVARVYNQAHMQTPTHIHTHTHSPTQSHMRTHAYARAHERYRCCLVPLLRGEILHGPVDRTDSSSVWAPPTACMRANVDACVRTRLHAHPREGICIWKNLVPVVRNQILDYECPERLERCLFHEQFESGAQVSGYRETRTRLGCR